MFCHDVNRKAGDWKRFDHKFEPVSLCFPSKHTTTVLALTNIILCYSTGIIFCLQVAIITARLHAEIVGATLRNVQGDGVQRWEGW